MSERPEEGREERRRTGPLGDDDETRPVPTENGPEATRPVTTGRASRRPSQEENETRVIRSAQHPDTVKDATPYPRGYFEAAEEREDRLRDMYGGVDWLASFLGYVFTVVLALVFSAIAGLVLVPFGFPPEISGGQLGASVLTDLAVLGVLIFLTYFFGGYVAGRLARFDGGRNGAMVLVWTFIVALILALVAVVFSGFLPAGMADGVSNLARGTVSTATNLAGAGVAGIIVAVAALLLALLGGFFGGRLGSRYHTEIDRAS
ncbi:MAG TPA: hypothetical protein VIZ60_11835 [Rubrobacter sp.]